jgi:hypothetical protein
MEIFSIDKVSILDIYTTDSDLKNRLFGMETYTDSVLDEHLFSSELYLEATDEHLGGNIDGWATHHLEDLKQICDLCAEKECSYFRIIDNP